MVEEIIKEVEGLKDQFLQLTSKDLTADQLRQVYNDLTAINIEVDRLTTSREEIYKRTENIKQILHSHDENKSSSTTKE